MLVVLNHIDEVPDDRRDAMLADVRRLLDADGLGGVPVLATSARTGEGIDELRASHRQAGRRQGVDAHPPGRRHLRRGRAG